VVAVDEQKKRTGAYLELLGTYNPLTEPKEILLKQDRIDEWLKKGAQPSDGYLRIIGKMPQRPPRKPKKEQKAPAEKATVAEAKPTEKGPVAEEEAPVEAAQEVPTPVDQIETSTPTEAPADQPVASEESIKEAPMPETAQEAAEVLAEPKEDKS